MEVLDRRTKRKNPCANYDSYDQYIIESILTKAGCKPPYFRNMSTYPPCANMTAMTEINDASSHYFYGIGHTQNTVIPCKEIVKIGVDFDMEAFDIQKWLINEWSCLDSNG